MKAAREPPEPPGQEPTTAAACEQAVIRAVEEYSALVRAGQRPDRQAFLARHASCAAELAECLDGMEFVCQAVPELSQPEANPGGPAASPLGDFRLVREVGRGGMGVVYEAVQLSLDRRVALKVLPFASTLDARQLQRFKNEAQAAAHLHHTNIVPVFATGCERGVHYYAMQFIDGYTLAAWIEALRQPAQPAASGDAPTGPYLPESAAATPPVAGLSTERPVGSPAHFQTVARLGAQAAAALEHAHQLGIVHRDIKPANLLVDGRGNLWVTDFGLAHCQGQAGLTMTGDLVGTLRYMSPEQALAQRVVIDHRTDVYSLGVTLYELLTLEPAFAGSTRHEVLRQIAFEEPRPPRRLNRPLPAELETIVLKALEKNPAERYGTAQELADDLERWLKDEPIRAKRPTLLQWGRKWARRHQPVVWAATVCCLVTAMALAASIGWAIGDRATRRAQVAGQVRESMNTARTLIADNQVTAARQKLAEAQVLLGHDRAALGELAAEVEAAAAELDRFQQFLDLIGRAHEAETAPVLDEPLAADGSHGRAATLPPVRLPERRPAAAVPFLLEALQRYAILDGDAWNTALEGSLLGRDQVAHIRRSAYEELLWLADDVARRQREHRSGQRLSPEAAARQALVYLGKAESAHRPTHALYAMRARCRKALGEEAAARADWQLADQTPPTLACDHHVRGMAAHQAKQLAAGVQAYEAALRLEPTHYWSMMWLGHCLADLAQGPEDLAGATRVYTGCILKRPNHAYAYSCRARAYRELRRYAEALTDCSKAIELDPNFAHAWHTRGLTYSNMGRADRALADYSQAIELDPTHAPARTSRGNAHSALGQWDRALADHAKALELDPKYAQAHNNLAWLLATCPDAKLRDPGRAVELAKKAVQLAPQKGMPWNTLGVAHYRTGDWKAAVAALDKSVELGQGGDAFDHLFLAMAHRKLGNHAEAGKWYDRAVAWLAKNKAALARNKALAEELQRIQSEAEEVLELKAKQPPLD
jgi:serine/threonine protein kinase/Flp pilus assembly protein TadD